MPIAMTCAKCRGSTPVHVPSPLSQSTTASSLDSSPSSPDSSDDVELPPSSSLSKHAVRSHHHTHRVAPKLRPAPLVGRYEHSVLSCRLASPLARTSFEAQLAVIGSDGASAHQIRLPFDAYFATPSWDPTVKVTAPYMGKIDLGLYYANQLRSVHKDAVHQLHMLKALFPSGHPPSCSPTTMNPSTPLPNPPPSPVHDQPLSQTIHSSSDLPKFSPPTPPSFPGYRVPRTGRVQLVLRGPGDARIPRILIVPYDVHALQPGQQRIVRHTCYAQPVAPRTAASSLRYAIQLRFAAALLPARKRADSARAPHPTPRVYLYSSIRLAFCPRLGSIDAQGSSDDGERLVRTTRTWGLPTGSPSATPSDLFVRRPVPLHPMHSLDPLVSFDPRGLHALFPPLQTDEDIDALVFQFSGPGHKWTHDANRTRAAVRTLRDRVWAYESYCRSLAEPQPSVAPSPLASSAPKGSSVSARADTVQAHGILATCSVVPRTTTPYPPDQVQASSSSTTQSPSLDYASPSLSYPDSNPTNGSSVAPVPVSSSKLLHARQEEQPSVSSPSC